MRFFLIRMNIKPPNCFILPPEYIYTDEFHDYIYKEPRIINERFDRPIRIFKRPHGNLFYKLIRGTEVDRSDIRGFCQSIYGVHKFNLNQHYSLNETFWEPFYKSYCQALLYLDGAPTLPTSFIDTECLNHLKLKYHKLIHRESKMMRFTLISSRRCVQGERMFGDN